jgi:hypothetical protein
MVNPNRFYTYAYLREDRTPYYVGKGGGNRLYEKHQKGIYVPKDKNRIIFLKQNLTEEEAFKHEIYMIAVFGRKDLGTGILHNRTDGGEGISGLVHSNESKKRMSKAHKGKILSEEHKRKIGEINKGKTLSEEHKIKISEANKNPSEEIRKIISEAHKGKVLSGETKRKIKEKRKDQIITQEHKNSISNAFNKEYCFISPSGEIVKEITTLSKFSKKYNLNKSCLSNLLNGKRNHHKGWTYNLNVV